MAVQRVDIERALDELVLQEEGMRFQGLAVVLGRLRWPELIAHERHKDFGLDAYAGPGLTPEKIGKGLASSITPTFKKISSDAETAKKNFPDLAGLLFVTPEKVGNKDRREWTEEIQKKHGIDVHIISREDVITTLMMPANAGLCASHLHLDVHLEPQVADLIAKTKAATADVAANWAAATKGYPLIGLDSVRLDDKGAETSEVFSLQDIDRALSQSRRIVLEGAAGSGKTTTLVQLAQQPRTGRSAFLLDLPAWTVSRKNIVEYIAGMPAFQAQAITAANLASIQASEGFLFLLNGWNEIAEMNSAQATDALRELERAFPAAGIIVATRTHHLTPPLLGATRLRLMSLRRRQRADYLTARLGAKAPALHERLDAEAALDELTRTPLILSEVVSLFEAGKPIPETKIDVLAAVIRLQEEGEHKNGLQAAPLYGQQHAYLDALATEMTRRGAVDLPDAEARRLAVLVGKDLLARGQIASVQEPAPVLAALTAHHVLERRDYPQTEFRFAHQQFQEHYAALGVRAELLALHDADGDGLRQFTASYVNDPAWAEPLRMVGETFASVTGDVDADKRQTLAGRLLVQMALGVDPVFAAGLARLCGGAVWREVRDNVGKRLRDIYAIRDQNYRALALAAMLATGSDDFKDILLPLFSNEDQQVRLGTYRLWPDIQVESLGTDWRDRVRGWNEAARADFVSELLHHRLDSDIAAFAVDDPSAAVKKAAASSLFWTRSDDAAMRVLESMDAPTFEQVARKNANRLPGPLRDKTVVALRDFIDQTQDQPAKLRTVLDLIEMGEAGLDDVLKEALTPVTAGDMRNLGPYYIEPALKHLAKTDPAWMSEWVAIQVGENALYPNEYWLRFASAIPDPLVEKFLERLETEDLSKKHFGGVVAVVAARAGATLAARVFSSLRDQRRKIDADPETAHPFEHQVMRQLDVVFRDLPDDVRVAGLLQSVTPGDPLDIRVATDLFSRTARSDAKPLQLSDDDLKGRARAYFKGSIDVVLRQDDFNGEQKADLASCIAQLGHTEDMTDLVRLIRADIERVRQGREVRAKGDRGPRGNGATTSYSSWHIASVLELDSADAEPVLIELLSEPEYGGDAAGAMARDFLPKPERTWDTTFRYELMWPAREGRLPAPKNSDTRLRYAAALSAEIKRLLETSEEGKPPQGVKTLGNALAAIDGSASMPLVLEVLALPGQWDEGTRVEMVERLLSSGAAVPVAAATFIVDSILARTEKYGMQDSDKYVLRRALSACAFVDDPIKGIARVHEVLGKKRLWGHELREIVTALGESRCDDAVDLLLELAADQQTFEQCEDNFFHAFAALDTARARDILIGFVDPANAKLVLPRHPHREDILIARVTELARREPKIAASLCELCDRDLPDLNRHLLSKVMNWLGTSESLTANLNLINDARPSPVPQGVRDQLETAFVERRPYGDSANVFTQHARASNDLRTRLFKMATSDENRHKMSAINIESA
jgi:hypothetical protein